MNAKNVSPYFKEDLRNILRGIYAAARVDDARKLGFLTALYSFALAVGISPSEILSSNDLEFTRSNTMK